MSEVSERWHDWRYDGRGYYLVNDPEITFQDDAEADAYCDEHNRALVGQAALEERAKTVAWLREKQEAFQELMDLRKYPLVSKHHMEHCKHSADAIEAGEHLK
jgi:hypothetical protein